MDFVELVEGPLWYGAVVVFVGGVLWRLVELLRLPRRADLAVPRGSGVAGALGTLLGRFWPRREAARKAPLVVAGGYMFHLGLFALVLFGAPHVRFIEERILGFGWTPMPHWAFVLSAEVAFAGLMLLWLRRILHPVTRMLSTADDHVAAGLVFLAMLTGCLALMESFTALRVLHMLSVELLMVYFPFSALMHTFTFALGRAYTGATYARRGVGV